MNSPQKRVVLLLLALLMVACLGCARGETVAPVATPEPIQIATNAPEEATLPTPIAEPQLKYIFLFIGDGMGYNQVQAASEALAAAGSEPLCFLDFPVQDSVKTNNAEGTDGVFLFSHTYGCSQLGDDHINTRTMLQNMVRHPNAGAVLVIGLGCENNQVAAFRETLGDIDPERVHFMICQQQDDEIEAGIEHLHQLYNVMRNDKREPGKLSELKFGLECGGSDGLSGITANPMLGRFSDYVIANGGTTVLTEVPEMFGAEQLLMDHCRDEATFEKLVTMVNDFKQYFIAHDQPIYENPSPGNKAGGITTLEDKSLGCTQKAGSSVVVDVLRYGERLKTPGLNLLSAPGNDAVATSALAGAGCHMVLFSTGRGTPYGGFVPTVKIATNSELAAKKKHWIDFDAGQLIHGKAMPQLLEEFIDTIVEFANGKQTCNERNDFRELAIFKSGVTL